MVHCYILENQKYEFYEMKRGKVFISMEAIRNEENMQQLKKVQKLIIGMGEALLCYGAEISRVEETIQRVADHFQIEEVEMYVITNGLFVNVHQQEEHTSTRLKYVPSISVNMKKLCDINELPAGSNRKIYRWIRR